MNIVFLHPPSIYDFRRHLSYLGPISEAVPSTPVFEMYPIGFITLAEYLQRHNIKVRIVNLALKMLKSEKFDVEKFIKKIDADLFCIDLHWLAHTQGAIEISRLCKRLHPAVPVVLGGLTATYYHQEILKEFEFIDFVLRGDSCEEPLLKLIKNLSKEDKNNVPNLSWRYKSKIVVNPITYVLSEINGVIDPKFLAKLMLRDRDIVAYLPYKLWLDAPIIPVLISKGCLYNCPYCGGSQSAYTRYCNRRRPAFMNLDSIIKQLKIAQRYFKSPVFFLNDIRMAGEDYYQNLFKRIVKENINVPVVFELFKPLDEDFARLLKRTFHNYNLEMSPEDASEKVRYGIGKKYTNSEVIQTIETALRYGCDKFDLFFMIGLGNQKEENIYQTLDFIEQILKGFKYARGRVYPIISAYAPTLDPGSLAFENPSKYGYKLRHRTLFEQYQAFKRLSWKEYFNYETEDLSVDKIVELVFSAIERLADIKERYGLINPQENLKIKQQLKISKTLMERLEVIERADTEDERRRLIADLNEWRSLSLKSFIHKRRELNWPVKSHSIYLTILRLLSRLI